MNIVSLGSNCEVSMMIEGLSKCCIQNAQLYTHLFAWSKISIIDINYFLKNPEFLDINNFKPIYRLFHMNGDNISKDGLGYYDVTLLLEDLIIIPDIHTIHIDMYYDNDGVNSWSHGIIVSISEFDQKNIDTYLDCVRSKINHLIQKTLNIMSDDSKKLFCVKCLRNEYTLQDLMVLKQLLLQKSSNNYIAIIAEEDDNVNLYDLELSNMCVMRVPKLTGHHEAVYYDRYGTDFYYKQLFEYSQKLFDL